MVTAFLSLRAEWRVSVSSHRAGNGHSTPGHSLVLQCRYQLPPSKSWEAKGTEAQCL